MALGNLYRLRHWQSVDGKYFVNRYYLVEELTGSSKNPCSELGRAFDVSIVLALQACLSNLWRSEYVEVSRLSGAAAPPAIEVDPINGSDSGNAIPLNAPAILDMKATYPGGFATGRLFISGFALGRCLEGQMTAAWRLLANPFLNAVKGTVSLPSGTGYTWKVALLEHGDFPPRQVNFTDFRWNVGNRRSRRRRPGVGT